MQRDEGESGEEKVSYTPHVAHDRVEATVNMTEVKRGKCSNSLE